MMESEQHDRLVRMRGLRTTEVSFMLLLALDNLGFCGVPDVNIAAV